MRKKEKKESLLLRFWPPQASLSSGLLHTIPLGPSVQYCHTSHLWEGEQTKLTERTPYLCPTSSSSSHYSSCRLLCNTYLLPFLCSCPASQPCSSAGGCELCLGIPHPYHPSGCFFTQQIIAGYVVVDRDLIMGNLGLRVFLIWQIISLL